MAAARGAPGTWIERRTRWPRPDGLLRLVLTGARRPPAGTRCVHSGPRRPSSIFTDGSEEPSGRSALRVTLDTLVGETQVSVYGIRTAAARRSGLHGLAAGEHPGQTGP